jgi:hypothetical protein
MSRDISSFAQSRSQLLQEKPQQSEPPTDSDFKSYVLYVASADKRDAVSVKALDALSANSGLKLDTMIQITDNLLEKPNWMSVLPVIVSKSEKRAYSGPACVEFIAQAKSSIPQRTKRRGCDSRAAWSE